MVLSTTLALCLALAVAESAQAVVQKSNPTFEQRAKDYDRLLVTPPHTSAEQHHLIAVTLAAHETQVTDPAEIASALDMLSSMVTYLVQSDTQFTWNGLAWVYDTRTAYSYSGTKVIESITQSYDDTLFTWSNSDRLVITYDGGGRPTTYTSYTWDGANWVEAGLTTFTYDGSGNLTYALYQHWDGLAWANDGNSTMTYNGSLLATSISQIWFNNDWMNVQKHVYTYSNGHLIEDMSQAPTGPSWSDAERVTYTLDGSGRATIALSERWGVSGPWTNWYKDAYAYDGSTTNETLHIHLSWNTGTSSWDSLWNDTTHYSGGKRIQALTYYYPPFGQLYRSQYTYDGLGNLVADLDDTWNGFFWQNDSRGVYVYTIAGIFDDAATADLPASFEIGQNYPNPFNQSTIIPYTLASDSRVQIRVSNLLGQTVATLVDGYQATGSHSVTWDGLDMNGRDVASGLYFLRVQVGEHAQIKKMVLLK
jgi:flagellar hook assembly protein FlgD